MSLSTADITGPNTVVDDGVPDTAPLRGPFFEEIGERKQQERDAKIILTAKDGQTGVGKSICGVFLAKLFDTSPGGWSAEKATLDPPEMMEMYGGLDKGSAVILDEAEQLDSRRSMSNENVDASHTWQMERVRQIVAILILPSPEEIDTRMERLADYWVNVERRGRARVYKKKIHPIKRKVYYKTLQTIEFPNLDTDPDYRELSRMKDDLINDPDRDDNYIRKSEHEKIVEKREKKARREMRDEIIRRFVNEEGWNTTDVAPGVELSSQRVGQIARGE